MKIVADENVHPIVIARLRDRGHYVFSIAERMPGTSDHEILNLPEIRESILITYDRDFGDLIFSQAMQQPYAIIYSRLGRAEPRYLSDIISELLDNELLAEHIHVITKNGIRLSRFPPGVF